MRRHLLQLRTRLTFTFCTWKMNPTSKNVRGTLTSGQINLITQVVAETDDVTSPAEVPPVTSSSAEVVQWPCSDLHCCCFCFKIT